MKLAAPTTTVYCQMAKRDIAGTMCRVTQGQEGCKNCAASSRICEECNQRPVRFPLYGLCFTCTVSEFGDDWETQEDQCAIVTQTDVICDEDHWDTQVGMEVPVSAEIGEIVDEERYQHVRGLVIKHQNATYKFISGKTGITLNAIAVIMRRLEQEGVVGKPCSGGGRSRLVLITPNGGQKSKDSPFRRRYSNEEKIDALKELLHIVGSSSNFGQKMLEMIEDYKKLEKVRLALNLVYKLYVE